PELASNLLPGFNATPDGLSGPKALDPSPPPSGASYGSPPDHGQAVAGLIAAVTNNGLGIAGVGWNRVKVLPIKVFYFVGSQYTTTTDVLARAIRYAADGGADVINLSLGGPQDLYLQGAISYALSKGTVVVAAAGNEGTDGLLYPARYPGVIAAGSVRLDGTRSDFSNCSSSISDLVMAPGEGIMSLALGKDYGYYKGLGPVYPWSGTSLSAPQVAGVAAMYIAQYRARYGKTPNLDQVRTCLTMTASNGRRYDPETGWGIIRADQVLEDTTYCFP
ncbi:MAG: S8 family serine peptidase, partial [Thermaceae bacterium]